MEEAKEKDGTDVINIKEKIEELVNNLDDIEMSGAAFFIGVNNRTGKIFIALSRVDIPAEKDKKGSASIRMYDHEYLMTHEETEMLKYRDGTVAKSGGLLLSGCSIVISSNKMNYSGN